MTGEGAPEQRSRRGGHIAIRWWCYMCDEAHPWRDPCAALLKLRWVQRERARRRRTR